MILNNDVRYKERGRRFPKTPDETALPEWSEPSGSLATESNLQAIGMRSAIPDPIFNDECRCNALTFTIEGGGAWPDISVREELPSESLVALAGQV
jgi:hypothetical protein